jgi:hypothetical protein
MGFSPTCPKPPGNRLARKNRTVRARLPFAAIISSSLEMALRRWAVHRALDCLAYRYGKKTRWETLDEESFLKGISEPRITSSRKNSQNQPAQALTLASRLPKVIPGALSSLRLRRRNAIPINLVCNCEKTALSILHKKPWMHR